MDAKKPKRIEFSKKAPFKDMIFLNNSGLSSSGRSSRYTCRSATQFGSISRNAHHDDLDETDNLKLGLIVASFGIAITLGLVLLPLFICCSAVTKHPLFLSGVGLFVFLILVGLILSGFHSGFLSFGYTSRCWWYKNQESDHSRCCGAFSRQRSFGSHPR